MPKKHRQQRKRKKKINAMILVAPCPKCGEEVRMGVSKRQILAMAVAFKKGKDLVEMEKIAEGILGRNPETGDLNQ